ncbi:MAG: 16S rRNA (guanine(527)-N(7))-methyltransferase RsmG [Spirochaetaceae bacterium]|nr:16S rRNA (guanine(527)-N(7))-methyltransferase RsmG [Spirochaetaceae bacterium]
MGGAFLQENAGWILKMDPIEHLNIAEYLQEASLKVSADKLKKLQLFHGMLRKENERINVTRLYGADAMGRKHYVDSLLPEKLLRDAGLDLSSPCMDLGSGGGFPGIPLAILRPEIVFRLVEGRRKRTEFLSDVAEHLGLTNVEVISRKLNSADRIECNSAISRAFMSIPETLDLCNLSVNPGGLFIFWKGPDCDDEIRHAEAYCSAWRHLKTIDYRLPGTADKRRLVVFQRLEEERFQAVRTMQKHKEEYQTGALSEGGDPDSPYLASPQNSDQHSDLNSGSEQELGFSRDHRRDEPVHEIALSDRHGVPSSLQSRIRTIESDANPKFKDWARLDQSKWIKKTGQTLVSGRKIVPEILNDWRAPTQITQQSPEHKPDENQDISRHPSNSEGTEADQWNGYPEALLIYDSIPPELFSLLSRWPELPVFRLKTELFRRLDLSGTKYPLILWNLDGHEKIRSVSALQPAGKSMLVLPLSLPDNLGAAVRTARGFGINAVLLTSESVFPFHPGVIRSSSGTCLKMAFFQGPALDQIQEALKENGLDPETSVLLDHRSEKPLRELIGFLENVESPVFIVGQEGKGLPDIPGTRFRIPISGLESLNAVASVTALLYEWHRHLD